MKYGRNFLVDGLDVISSVFEVRDRSIYDIHVLSLDPSCVVYRREDINLFNVSKFFYGLGLNEHHFMSTELDENTFVSFSKKFPVKYRVEMRLLFSRYPIIHLWDYCSDFSHFTIANISDSGNFDLSGFPSWFGEEITGVSEFEPSNLINLMGLTV